MYYIAKSVVASLPLGNDPEKEQHEQARVKAQANLRRLGRSRGDSDTEYDSGRSGNDSRRARKEDFELDQYESQIAMEVVSPEDIPVGFDGMSAVYRFYLHANPFEILAGSTILLKN
jgi:hypothetical protein